MTDRQNRTIICSVMFLDMVEYSRKAVAEQMNLRERFNLLLRDALKSVAPNDRVVLDTGDGAAITFLGDPEDALFLALKVRDAIAAEARRAEQPLSMRCGINLGPVKLVKDINSRPNIIGDGINVAQRIMGFSQPGQVLVSRSYFEVVSRLSSEYSNLFKYEGARTDKHVREHEVYAVSREHRIPARAPAGARSGRFAALGSVGAVLGRLQDLGGRILESLHASPRMSTVVAALAIVALGVVARANRETSAAPVAARNAPVAQRVAMSETRQAPPLAPLPSVPAPDPTPPAVVPAEATEGKQVPAAAPDPPKKLAAAKPAKTAKKEVVDSLVAVSLAVLPWGEVYVDGKQRGVSPPLRAIELAPGRHQIEFRNTTFPNHVETVDVKFGENLTVRHKFQGGESR